MKKSEKGIFIGLGILCFLALSVIALNIYISNRIEGRINEIGNSTEYEQLEIGFLGKNIELTGFSYMGPGTNFKAEQISLEDIGLFQYLLNDKIAIDNVTIIRPLAVINSDSETESEEEQGQEFNRNVSIEHFQITDGIFKLKKQNSEDNKFYSEVRKLKISNIQIDSSTLKKKIPFEYNSYEVVGDSIQVELNKEHDITINKWESRNGKILIRDFRITPLYNKPEFDKVIPYEKDRFSLDVDSINLEDLSFSFRNDTLHLSNSHMRISQPELLIYRNRSLPDDPRSKNLYSQTFRELPFKLDFDTIRLSEGKIVYEEAVTRDGGPARIAFHQLEGTIENLTNMNLDREDYPRTQVVASALFMNEARLEIDWSFDISNHTNKFLFSGESERLPASALNPYMIPALGIEANGAFNSIYFTFTGNEKTAVGDVLVNYENFSIDILKDGSREEKGIITAIANLFLDNNGHSGDNEQKNVEVERDEKKSFWSYIWSAVKKGLMESVKQF